MVIKINENDGIHLIFIVCVYVCVCGGGGGVLEGIFGPGIFFTFLFSFTLISRLFQLI